MDELVVISCKACGGDGYTLDLGNVGRDGLPAETPRSCEVCGGTGEVEVCGGCLEVPQIAGGFELCACLAVPLSRAA